MSRLAAKKCYEAAGLKPSDVDVIELHDCFSANELITYEALGLCPEGKTAAHVSSSYFISYWRFRERSFRIIIFPHKTSDPELHSLLIWYEISNLTKI